MYSEASDYRDDSIHAPFEFPRYHLWNSAWEFFRDELSLEKFSMGILGKDREPMLIQGPDDGPGDTYDVIEYYGGK